MNHDTAQSRGVRSSTLISTISTVPVAEVVKDDQIPASEKWPASLRLAIIVGIALAFWAAIIAIVRLA